MVKSWVKRLVVLFFFIAVFLQFVMPIWDVDFPWHLKTGEYIFQHHEIPEADPFTDASNGSMAEKFILSNYWLAQVFFYLIFLKAGPLGIVILRAALLTGIIIILWRSMKNTPLAIKVVLLYLTATFLLAYSGERPQLFSFLFSLIIITLTEDYRNNGSIKSLLFLPLLMLIWAQMHGGFIFGDMLIILICLSEVLKYFFLKKYMKALNDRELLALAGVGLLAIVVSYLNPNTYQGFTIIFDSIDPSGIFNREYITPFSEIRSAYGSTHDFIYWALMGYCLILLAVNLKRLDLTHLMLVCFTLFASLTAIRFAPFFLMTGLFLSGFYSFGSQNSKFSGKILLAGNLALLVIVISWFGLTIYHLPDKTMLTEMGRSMLHCEKAARFIKDEIREGKIFNSPSTGGYLILRLFPQFKVFTDTRAYNPQNLIETDAVGSALRWEGDREGFWDTFTGLLPKKYGTLVIKTGTKPANPPKKELWAEILDRHKIDIIVHEACSLMSGDLYHLPLRLVTSDEWKLVYLDGRVLIYVRNVPKYRELIAKHQLDKSRIYDEIGMESMRGLNTFHSAFYSNIAFALLMKDGPDTSVKEFIEHALYLNPKDVMASCLATFMQLKEAHTTSNPSR